MGVRARVFGLGVALIAFAALVLVPADARAADAAPSSASSEPAGSPTGNAVVISQPAAGTSKLPPGEEIGDWIMRHNHTIAEFEIGFMALPNAPISPGQQGGNLPIGTIGHGDATESIGLHLLYRGGLNWAIGAGALYAPRPTADTTYGGASGLQRTHSRDYLWLGAEGRYIPIHFKTVDAWAGAAVGGVVVADRYDTNTGLNVPPDLGTSEVTVRTEGFSIGFQIGAEWAFAERLVLGFVGRYDQWILPSNAQCTPIGDCATLSGPVTELEVGLRLGYRIPL